MQEHQLSTSNSREEKGKIFAVTIDEIPHRLSHGLILNLIDCLEKDLTLASLYAGERDGSTVRQRTERLLESWRYIMDVTPFPNACLSEREFILILALLNVGEALAADPAKRGEETWRVLQRYHSQLPFSENGWKAAELLIRHRLLENYFEHFLQMPLQTELSSITKGHSYDHRLLRQYQDSLIVRSGADNLSDGLERAEKAAQLVLEIRHLADTCGFNSSALLKLMVAVFQIESLSRTFYSSSGNGSRGKVEREYIFSDEFLLREKTSDDRMPTRFALYKRVEPFFATLNELSVAASEVLQNPERLKDLCRLRYFKSLTAAAAFTTLKEEQRRFLKDAQEHVNLGASKTNGQFEERLRLIEAAIVPKGLPVVQLMKEYSTAAEAELLGIYQRLAEDAWQGRLGRGILTILPIHTEGSRLRLPKEVSQFVGNPWPLDPRFHFVRNIPLSRYGCHSPFCGIDGSFPLYPSPARITELINSHSRDYDYFDSHHQRPKFTDLSILAKKHSYVAIPDFALAPVGEIDKSELGLIFQSCHHNHGLSEWAKILDRETIEKFWPLHSSVKVGKLYNKTSIFCDGGLEIRLDRLPSGRYAVSAPGYFGDYVEHGGAWGESETAHDLHRYYIGAVTSPLVSILDDFILCNDNIRLLNVEISQLTPDEKNYLLKQNKPERIPSESIFNYRTGIELRGGPFPAFVRGEKSDI